MLPSSLAVASSGITYHGKIMRPDGVTPVSSTNTQFRIQVRTPGTANCLLWEEHQTKDLSATDGVFTITIADTSEPTLIPNTLPYTLERTFSNRTNFTGLTGCSSGSTYNPNPTDGRLLVVSFRENGTDPWEQMPITKINFVPIALNSVQLAGYEASEFLKIDSASSYTPLTATQVNTLMDIIAGTNTQYLRPSTTFSGDVSGTYNTTSVDKIKGVSVSSTAPTNGQVLKLVGGVWTPAADDNTGTTPGDASYSAKGVVQINTDQATSGLYIASGVLAMPNVITAGGPTGGAQTVPVITYDQKGRLTAVTTATVDDNTKLPLAGGTMTGSINMGTQNITNATSVATTNVSTRNVILADGDTNTITVRAPADISSNFTLTMPVNDGAAGEVLSTDGNGVLSWVSSSAGSVTSVTSANSYLSIANTTSTPVITANVGTAANTLAAGDDSRITGALQTSVYDADVAPAATCTTTQTSYWNTVSGTWACQNIGTVSNATTAVNFSGSLAGDVSGTQGATSVDKIKGKTVSAATATNQIMIYDGTNWVNNVVSGDATLASTGALTLANTVTAGSAGSASAVPTITYDAKGRITGTSSAAYQDATAAQKGVVQIGSNISVSSGTISLSGSNVTTALGYTPVNKAGDTMSGTLGLYAVAADPSTAGWDATQKGYTWFNTTSNQVKYWDGSAIQALGVSGAGLTSLGGQTGSTQTFAAGSSGNSPAISSAANVHTLNVPLASAGASVTSGTISNTDYVSFSGKLTSPLTTKGDLLTRDATTHVRLPAGTDGQVLTADSAEASGLKWTTPQTGDITEVVAGAGLTGGATSGSATVNVAAGTGIVVNADDVAVDVGTTAGKIVQVQTGGKLPALDGSDLTNLDAGDIASGTLPIARGGTGQTTANAALNALLPSQATHSGKVLQTDGTNTSWVAASTGTVTSVTSANSYLSIATTTTTPVITANVGTSANTLAAGDDSRITGALQTTAYNADLTPAASCTTSQTAYWNTVSDTWACQNIKVTGAGAFFVDGGNSLGAAATLGTNDNNALNFETNGTNKMTVLADGNVGIGNTSPASKLEVRGEIAVKGTLGASESAINLNYGISSGVGQNAIQLFPYLGANTITGFTGMIIDAPTVTTGSYTDYTGLAIQASTAGSGNMYGLSLAIPAGTNRYNIYASSAAQNYFAGNVGIGAAAVPSTALDVGGAITQRGMAAPAVSPAGQGRIYFDSTSNKYRVSENGGAYSDLVTSVSGSGGFVDGGNTFSAAATLGTNSNHALNFETNGSNRMTILADGKVGIATSAPNSYLHVGPGAGFASSSSKPGGASTIYSTLASSSGSVSQVIGINDGSRNTRAEFFVTDHATEGSGAFGIWSKYSSAGSQPFVIGVSDTERFRIDGTGNIGIGTNAPSSILDVNGAITQRGIASPAVSSAGQGRIYFDSTSNTFKVSQNGGAFTDLVAAAGTNVTQSAYTADLTPAASCTTTQTPYWNTVADTWACQNIKVTGAGAFYVDGGNSLGATATVGTNDNYALNIETNGSNRMTVDETGKVGVGTTAPETTLDVNGPINMRQAYYESVGDLGSPACGATNITGFTTNLYTVTACASGTTTINIPTITGWPTGSRAWSVSFFVTGQTASVFNVTYNGGTSNVYWDMNSTGSAGGNNYTGFSVTSGNTDVISCTVLNVGSVKIYCGVSAQY